MLIPSILSHEESYYLLYTLGVAVGCDLDRWLITLAMPGTRTWEERTVLKSSLQHILGREGTEIKMAEHRFLNNSGSISCFPTRWFRAVIQRGCSVVLLPSKTFLSVFGGKNHGTPSLKSPSLERHFASTGKQGRGCRKMPSRRLQYPPLDRCMCSTGGMTSILSLKHESNEATSKCISLSNISLPGDS